MLKSLRRSFVPVLVVIALISCKKELSPEVGTVAALTQLNAAYGSQPLQNMDIYLPAGRTDSTTKVMIMIHGGAWVFDDKASFTEYVDTVKRRLPAYAIFNINYRLAAPPLNIFPTQEQDVKAAMEYIYNKRAEYGISDKFVMVGASAGGHLALLQAYKNSSPVKIKAVVDFFGPTDLVDLYNNPGIVSQNNLASIIGGTPQSNPAIYQQSSPINFAVAGAAVPTLILQGSDDPLVNATTQSAALRDKLQIAGVPFEYKVYPGKGHGDDWTNEDFSDAFSRLQAFLTTYNP